MYRLRQTILLAGDIIMLVAGFWCGLALRHLELPSETLITELFELFIPLMLLWIIINYVNGLYDLTKLHLKQFGARRIVETMSIVIFLSITYLYLFPGNSSASPKTTLLLTIACSYGFIWIWRQVFLYSIERASSKQRILFVGNNPVLNELIGHIQKDHKLHYQIAGVAGTKTSVGDVKQFSSAKDVHQLVNETHADIVVISPEVQYNKASLQSLYKLLFTHVQLINFTNFYEEITGRIPPYTFSESWFLEHLEQRRNPIYDQARTLADYFFAIFIGSIFVITFPFVALLIKATSRGKIFYKQERVGQYGKVFYLYKYRSMYTLSADGSAETNGVQFAKKGDTRVTAIGKLLRKTRIDEWPQVLNLLKRDITLIGPRPERPAIVEELERRMPYYSLRHIVRPGLSGWAVINQNYTDTYESSLEKLQYDLYYIKHRSIILDITTVLKTLNILIRFKGQ